MEYQFTIEKPGRGKWLYQFLSNNLDTFDTDTFDLKAVSRDGDKVLIDIDVDIDRLLMNTLPRIFNRNDYLRKEGFIMKLSKRIQQRKKAAPRKKAAKKKAVAKKK